MANRDSIFNRVLMIVLVVLYLITITAFGLANRSDDPGFNQWWMIALNSLILSIPLGLLFGSIYLLVVAWRQHTAGELVDPRLAKTIHWAPRVAALGIIFFISLFSLDVFEMQASPLEMLGGFLIHNIPTIALILLLLFAWRRPAVGFLAFLLAALFFFVFFVRDLEALPNVLLFVLPLLLIGCLFYADWKWLPPTAQAG